MEAKHLQNVLNNPRKQIGYKTYSYSCVTYMVPYIFKGYTYIFPCTNISSFNNNEH